MPPGFNRNPGQDRGPRAGATLRDLKKDSTVFRLFKFIFKNYKVNFVVVTLCIIVSSVTSLASPACVSAATASAPSNRFTAASAWSSFSPNPTKS